MVVSYLDLGKLKAFLAFIALPQYYSCMNVKRKRHIFYFLTKKKIDKKLFSRRKRAIARITYAGDKFSQIRSHIATTGASHLIIDGDAKPYLHLTLDVPAYRKRCSSLTSIFFF